MSSYKVYESDTDQEVTGDFATVNGLSTLDIFTNDRNLVGTLSLYLKAVLTSSNEELERQDLTLEIIDSCESAVLNGSINLQPVVV